MLGLSETDFWSMTMREFDALLRRKNERAKEDMRLACLAGGLAASAAYNAAGATKSNGQSFSAMDFMPKDEKKVEETDTPDEVLRQVEMLNIMMGGDKVVSE